MPKVNDKTEKTESKEVDTEGPVSEGSAPGQEQTGGDREEPMVPDASSERGEETKVRGGPGEAEEPEKGRTPEAGEGDAGPEPLSPEQRVEQLTRENEELQDKFVRLMADFDNYRKRASKEKRDVIQFGNEALLKDILPIIDNIERLLTYSYGEGNWKSFQEGIELLLAETGKTLAKYGVEPIEALGKEFDPNVHQAIQRSETDQVAANTVLEVYQKGYTYRGRLLRPSVVIVAVSPPDKEETAQEEPAPDAAASPEASGEQGEDEETPIN